MGEQATMDETAAVEVAVPGASPSDVLYVVQVARPGVVTADNEGREVLVNNAWEDIATVTAPLRSKRKTVIGLALAQSGLRPGADTLRLRVLDAASAHETEIAPFQPDAEWKIG